MDGKIHGYSLVSNSFTQIFEVSISSKYILGIYIDTTNTRLISYSFDGDLKLFAYTQSANYL